MKVLCACEYTQEFTMALRQRGVDSYSCDILAGEKDGTIHFMDDLENVLKVSKFDAVIGFPPCTYLTSAGAHLWQDVPHFCAIGCGPVERIFKVNNKTTKKKE